MIGHFENYRGDGPRITAIQPSCDNDYTCTTRHDDGSDADSDGTQFFIAVHRIKTLCLEKPLAFWPFASRATS